ncbi:hypothetical protein V6N12_044313 [Hibiscus sabdariffa]|uniref:RNase H type-1 domain-containing protein n=1 Tax=Hibiscus sabdariffa TaxID=183260 RepID=A0ABR2DI05_9ROSI
MLSVYAVGYHLIYLAQVVDAIMSLSSIFCVIVLLVDVYDSPSFLLWKRRNDFIFTGNCLPLPDVNRIGLAWASYFADATFVPPSSLQPRFDSFQWQAPPCDFLCLNTDAADSFPARLGTIEGVFRDSSGVWDKGFCKSIGIISLLQAELWNILARLQLAWSMGISCLQVQYDSSIVVRLVLEHMMSTSSSPLIHAIVMLSNRDWPIVFTRVPCKQNMVADSLSKVFPAQHYNLTIFDATSEIIRPLLDRDRDGPPYYRRSLTASSLNFHSLS